ncbi:MAG: YdcF family protein [Candidatus Magasanikbacteria bacterium]|jgi:uncharacterized SAM-binding protein YcdF (DUF218 family)|nr:YdcF family protein [Candidatus Magasanikbacteria bacterium]MBT4072023.1 YdcF family protein [Candidatus Magasanikbacteria bacterium]
MDDLKIKNLVKILWDYHKLNHSLKKMDAILVFGSYDTRVADRAVDLYLEGWAPVLIFTGASGRGSMGMWDKSEAEIFADIARKRGVREESIFIENNATNTGENVLFVHKLIKEKGLNCKSFILLSKPYMERRIFATFKKHFPDEEIVVTSPNISFENYPNKEVPFEKMMHSIMNDFERIKRYPNLGFQISQKIPKKVEEAYNILLKSGFDKYIFKK